MRYRRKLLRPAIQLLAVALLLPALFVCPSLRGTDISPQQQLMGMISASPNLPRGHIGFEFEDAETGEVLAQKGAREFFTPASNAKLFTTAMAIVRLGVTYQFKTAVRTSGHFMPGDTRVPDLIFIGGGDPNLSGRAIPFSQIEEEAKDKRDALSAVNRLADQVVAKGVKYIDGDIIGDDTRYPFDPYPDGWTFDDGIWSYGAPVSALSVNDNSVHLTVTPAEPNALAAITVTPEIGSFIVLNQVITDATQGTHVSIARAAGSNELVISGTLGNRAPVLEEDVAVADPALFAAEALRYSLEERGVAVHGVARARHRHLKDVPNLLQAPRLENAPSGTELAAIQSAPISQVVQVVNKVSQNLHAEMLLREVAYATRSVGTLEAGRDERQRFLVEAGLDPTEFALADGSGLARQDLTTPDSVVKLLRYMWNRPERDAWVQSLPVGGVDGTLDRRFKSVKGGQSVHAKTGSLSHVVAMSGYIQSEGGRWIIFSMMANAEVSGAKEVRSFFDQACGVFLGTQARKN
jgi:serine-type D-Ala-D-Ala carboxypeptidase/endopeptidase (penicillin-binding protein 4)